MEEAEPGDDRPIGAAFEGIVAVGLGGDAFVAAADGPNIKQPLVIEERLIAFARRGGRIEVRIFFGERGERYQRGRRFFRVDRHSNSTFFLTGSDGVSSG